MEDVHTWYLVSIHFHSHNGRNFDKDQLGRKLKKQSEVTSGKYVREITSQLFPTFI